MLLNSEHVGSQRVSMKWRSLKHVIGCPFPSSPFSSSAAMPSSSSARTTFDDVAADI
jgi:hypothetical protein